MSWRRALGALLERRRAAFEQRLLARWFPLAIPATVPDTPWALRPLTWLTALIAGHRRRGMRRLGPGHRPAVIVVGNLVVGGAGKTPLVAQIARQLSDRGWRVGILTRGHRARLRQARLVGPADNPLRHGDEPVMLAAITGLPVGCGIDRGAALALLLERHPTLEVIISDDGLQHPGLPRSLELAVFDERGAGNGLLLPAGPLREPLAHLRGMDAVLLREPGGAATALAALAPRAFSFRVEPVLFHPMGCDGAALSLDDFRAKAAGRRVHALAGIANPQRFFRSLAECGIDVRDRLCLSDHSPASPELLPADAELIVMTAKDAVKFTPLADARCWYLEVQARLEPAFARWLEESLNGSPTH